jgi:hypothetical protein
LSTECSRVSSQGGSNHRHRDRHSREHASSKRRKLEQQQQPEESSEHTTLRISSQVSVYIGCNQLYGGLCLLVLQQINVRRVPEIEFAHTGHATKSMLP